MHINRKLEWVCTFQYKFDTHNLKTSNFLPKSRLSRANCTLKFPSSIEDITAFIRFLNLNSIPRYLMTLHHPICLSCNSINIDYN